MASDLPLIGRTLAGRYTITGHIGEGGFATVYRGVQEGAEPRDVAIKVMNRELAGHRTFLRRFRREAKAAVRLKHPRIVEVLGYGDDDGVLYIAMELLIGQDLFEALARERRLPEARAVRIVAQVCDALEEAHKLGIVHRDLKPENVMILAASGVTGGVDGGVDGGERVKVLDFGIAKILETEPEEGKARPNDDLPPSSTRSALTRVGTAMGTPAYMSPEQGRAEEIDGRSDLYTCGVLLYQLITGRLPFEGETALQTIMQHVHDRPRPPSELVPSLHRGLEATILRALSKYADERHQTARELGDDLLSLLPALAVGRHQSLAPSRASGEEPASVILGAEARSPPLIVLAQGTPPSSVQSAPTTPSSDSTRTIIRDVGELPEQRAPSPPSHPLHKAPTPIVVEAPRPGPASSPAARPAPAEPVAGRAPAPAAVAAAISTLRSRIEDVTPFVGSAAAAAAARASASTSDPASGPVTVRARPRFTPAVAIALGVAVGLVGFALLTLLVVLLLR